MINNFADFCTWVYVIVDDIWQDIAPLFDRPGPDPRCSDSELMSMALIGECRGWNLETEMLSHGREHSDLFPIVPTQSRFNRRRRNLMYAFNLVRHIILKSLDIAQDRQRVIDSLPLPMVQFYLVPSSTGDWRAFEKADHFRFQATLAHYPGWSDPRFRACTCACHRSGSGF
jgi:hypothetical protein